MLGRRVARNSTERRLAIESDRPSVIHIIVREIDAAVVPGIAVSAVTRFHGDERSLGGVARGVLEEGTGRAGLVLAPLEEGGERGDAAGFAELVEEGAPLAGVVAVEGGARGGVGDQRRWGVLEQFGIEEREGFFE